MSPLTVNHPQFAVVMMYTVQDSVQYLQVSQAGKRLSPTDPDKTRPKPAVLPWFDMMRFMWRGGIGIHATYDPSCPTSQNIATLLLSTECYVLCNDCTHVRSASINDAWLQRAAHRLFFSQQYC